MQPFPALSHLRQLFRQGLNDLLATPQPAPGQLVLVAANAIALRDAALLERAQELAAPLLTANPAPAALAAVVPAAEPSEDLAILRFITEAPNPLNLVHHRTTPGGWRLQLNELRAHRPRRSAAAPATTIHQPFDPAKFNFTNVPSEAFWTDSWQNNPNLSLYYNKYPFEPHHTLVVPNPAASREQWLTAADHQLAWELCQAAAAAEPGIAVAYNALGAFASVNHLHFQLILGGDQLPLLMGNLAHHPLATTTETNPNTAWTAINQLQQANQPFNLLYTPSQVVIIPRRFQGSYDQPTWTTGFALYELAGHIITVDPTAYRTLTDAEIESAMAKLRP